MTNQTAIIEQLKNCEAILKGHFVLSSGLHSDTYIQCARVFMNTHTSEQLCSELAKKVRTVIDKPIDAIVAPAMGGVIIGYELSRHLQVPNMFCERQDGGFALRRGFKFDDNANILIVEDVVTTGKSSCEAMDCVRSVGGTIIGVASLVNRFGDGAESVLGVPLVSLVDINVQTYTDDNVPADLNAIEITKPGSRWIKK